MVHGIVDIPLPGNAFRNDSGSEGSRTRWPLLSSFLVGPENHLVEVAVTMMLAGRVNGHNPLVLCGPSGTGKSHLAFGLVDHWRGEYGRKTVIHTNAADFARELADAIATQATQEWRARYRKSRLLVFEDIGLLQNKPAAQEELIHTLDEVLAGGGRVVVTAAAAPVQLSRLAPRLQSRLIGGLTVSLVLPATATRLAILDRLAAVRGVQFSHTAARILAEGLPGTVPELHGALLQLEVPARLEGGAVNADAVRRFLAWRDVSHRPSLREIAVAVARFFSLKLAELRSPSRRRALVTARGVAMYLARHLTQTSLQRIGAYFGGRDHTTVIHACRKTASLLKTDPAIREAVARLEGKWRSTS